MRLDEFESVFRSAVRPTYAMRRPTLRNVTVVTDLQEPLVGQLLQSAEAMLADAHTGAPLEITVMPVAGTTGVQQLLDDLRCRACDLVVTHRHVLSHWRDTPHVLGSALSIFAQSLSTPVLMLPFPTSGRSLPIQPPARALVATRHLIDDSALVDWALHLTGDDGTVVLAHVEDAGHLNRFIDAIGRIRGIDTDLAKEKLPDKLLQLSRDYIESVVAEMQQHGVQETLVPEVRLGDPMAEFEAMLSHHAVDLLIGASREQQTPATDGTMSRRPPINGRTFGLAIEHPNLPVLFV